MTESASRTALTKKTMVELLRTSMSYIGGDDDDEVEACKRISAVVAALEATSIKEADLIREIRRRSSLHTEKDGRTHYHVDDSLLDELETRAEAAVRE